MKRKLIISILIIPIYGIFNICSGQDSSSNTFTYGLDPHYDKLVPDKIFEIGLPLLVLFLISNAVVNIFKIRAENKLKEKAMDKELSEATLISLFSYDKTMARYSYLKWFLILAALGVSFTIIQLYGKTNSVRSGYMFIGILALCMSLAFLIYFLIIRKK